MLEISLKRLGAQFQRGGDVSLAYSHCFLGAGFFLLHHRIYSQLWHSALLHAFDASLCSGEQRWQQHIKYGIIGAHSRLFGSNHFPQDQRDIELTATMPRTSMDSGNRTLMPIKRPKERPTAVGK